MKIKKCGREAVVTDFPRIMQLHGYSRGLDTVLAQFRPGFPVSFNLNNNILYTNTGVPQPQLWSHE